MLCNPSFEQRMELVFWLLNEASFSHCGSNALCILQVVHGNATPFTMEIPSKYASATSQPIGSRFTPVQYRTQPSHLPQHVIKPGMLTSLFDFQLIQKQ